MADQMDGYLIMYKLETFYGHVTCRFYKVS